MAHTTIIQNAIPTRYDPRVTVKPCDPARVPYLPVEILYHIAKALPQPKQVYNLALASKETWEYLQPALYECEVTYEARLAHKYGGESLTSLEHYSGEQYLGAFSDFGTSDQDGSWDSEYDTQSDGDQHDNDWEDDDQSNEGAQHGNDWESDIQSEDSDPVGDDLTTQAWRSHQGRIWRCPGSGIFGQCDECDGRIDIEKRIFKASMPEGDDPIRIDGGMTALHWAAKQGASALPVAQKAILSALTHQPSYINGLKLQERHLPGSADDDDDNDDDEFPRYIPADLAPPLFLAVAHGNVEVFKALLDAGCTVKLLQGQSVCGYRSCWGQDTLTSFKIHEECMKGEFDPCVCECKSEYCREDLVEEEPRICQTVGHIAVRYEQPEMLKVLLQGGLNIQPPQPKSLHLAQFAVRKASLAALKVLLDHDPSLAHSRLRHGTLLHSVRFIGQDAERSVRSELMRSTISCLLEHGANLDARADEEDEWSDDQSGTDDREPGGPTALQAALFVLETAVAASDPQLLPALDAAEVLISMGANWNQSVRPGLPGHILYQCLVRTITKTKCERRRDKEPDNSHTALGVELRAAFGRVFKAVVEIVCEPSTRDKPQNKRAFERTLPAAFADLVRVWSKSDASGGPCCPVAAKGIGRLLLSTGCTPKDADLKKWRTLCSGEDIRG